MVLIFTNLKTELNYMQLYLYVLCCSQGDFSLQYVVPPLLTNHKGTYQCNIIGWGYEEEVSVYKI